MRILWISLIAATLACSLQAQQKPRIVPPWSEGENNPAARKGYEFQVPDVDNVPDLHGNPADAKLALL